MSVSNLRSLLKANARNSGWSRSAVDLADYGGRAVGGYVKKKVKEAYRSPPRTPVKKQKVKSVSRAVSQNKTMGGVRGKRSAVSKLVNKSSMVMKGKRKNIKKVKTVKVSKAFRAKVKKVEEGMYAKGTYTKLIGGSVGSIVNSNTGGGVAFQNASIMFNSSIAWVGPNTLDPAGYRTLFNVLQPTNTIGAVNGQDLNFFTIRKIHDAASILFNERAVALDPYASSARLMTTTFDPTTGIPSSLGYGTLKIEVVNSWVQFKMKNVSNRILEVEIWECTPTLKFQDVAPLASLVTSLTTAGQSVVDTGVFDATVRVVTSTGSGGRVYLENNFDACSVAKKFGWNFNYVKRSMVLAPDETCIHSIKGPKGVLDMAKMNVENVAKFGMVKGFSVGCIISVVPDMAFAPSATVTGSRFATIAGVPGAVDSFGFSNPILIEVEESISIKVPEVAGFVEDAAGAGAPKSLQLRKSRMIYFNSLTKNGNTQAVPTVVPTTATVPGPPYTTYAYGSEAFGISNEENPAFGVGRAGPPV